MGRNHVQPTLNQRVQGSSSFELTPEASDGKPVSMRAEKEVELVKRLKQFAKQPTLSQGESTEKDDEMISVSRM